MDKLNLPLIVVVGKKCVQAVCSVGRVLCTTKLFAQFSSSLGNSLHSIQSLSEPTAINYTQPKYSNLIWKVRSYAQYPHNLLLLLFIYIIRKTKGGVRNSYAYTNYPI
jgi:hypothetical protein